MSNVKVHRERHGVESVGQHQRPHRLPHQQRKQQQLRIKEERFIRTE